MRVGIMQPYFLPYIGYFQLLGHCDLFVVYDDVKYTKRGWINRNRILLAGEPRMVSLPLVRDRDSLDVRERTIAPEFDARKMMRLFRQSYEKAPQWPICDRLLAGIVEFPSRNLFEFVANSISEVAAALDLSTDIVVSSSLGIERGLRGQDRILATCAEVGATEYLNPIGGVDLYDPAAFAERGMGLGFLRSKLTPYPQFSFPWVEALSIVDTMAFVAPEELATRLRSDYVIVRG